MKDIEKLQVLLHHWIEHNHGHEAEWMKWVEIAKEHGEEGIGENLENAVQCMKEANSYLEKALR